MKPEDILRQRLHNQQIAGTSFTRPEELVSWMVAMQAQEYQQAKWAIGLRVPGLTDTDIEKAFNDGAILRTHIMRPTWHFVCPGDIRWLQQLTAHRVHQLNGTYYRREELDAKVFRKSRSLIIKALEGGRHLTRAALKTVLEKGKITCNPFRLGLIMLHEELDGILCSGPRAGKQFTYALLEERVAPVKPISGGEALAGLTERYFATRGPATLQDFSWWSGLSIAEAKAGVDTLPGSFIREKSGKLEYIFQPVTTRPKASGTFLMPVYDEYGISYKDREILFDKDAGQSVFTNVLVVNGKEGGSWQKNPRNEPEVTPFPSLPKARLQEINNAVKRYRLFMK